MNPRDPKTHRLKCLYRYSAVKLQLQFKAFQSDRRKSIRKVYRIRKSKFQGRYKILRKFDLLRKDECASLRNRKKEPRNMQISLADRL